ncbi:MAG TPA: FG-GAP-like repeat-containing protein [Bacteroidia bacterium]|nr:FG-GAP-like repeat-containing protein [Bacteroidia bacterium]
MKTKINIIIAFCILSSLILITRLEATTYSWVGNTSTDWGTAANWGTGVPTTNDTVTITSAGTFQPVLDHDRTVKKFTMSSGTLNLNGYNLTISSVSTFTLGTISNGKIYPNGVQATYLGTTFDCEVNSVAGKIYLSGSTFNYRSYFEDTITNAAHYGGGGNTFNASVIIKKNSGSHFGIANTTGNTFNDTATFLNVRGTNTLLVTDQGTTYFNGHIYLGANTGGDVYFSGASTLASGKTINVDGTTGYTSGDLRIYNMTQSGSTAQSFTLTGAATVYCYNDTWNGAVSFTAPHVLIKMNTFNSTASLIQTSTTTGSNSDGGNTFNGAATISCTGGSQFRLGMTYDDTFNSDLTVTGNVQIGAANTTILKGNLTAGGSNTHFNSSGVTGTLKFAGSNSQHISSNGTGVIGFNKMKIDKTGGSVTLDTTITVDDTLTFVNGNFISTSSHFLSMLAASTVTGASNSSFVSGPVKKTGNTAFVFPTGKGSDYRAIEMSAPGSSTYAFTGEYFNTGQTLGYARDTTLYTLSQCNYWNLTRNVGSTNVTVKLYWDSLACGLIDSASVKVANWNGSTWKDLGNGGITGNKFIGKVVNSTTVVTYGNFTLGYHYNFFTKITTGPVVQESCDSYFASWGDYDNDGDLDLYHSLFFASPSNTTGNNLMFQNNCNGEFTRITNIPDNVVTDGLTGVYSNWVDYNNDGNQDLYVGPNYLYENQGNGSFITITGTAITAGHTIGDAGFADYDNDGLLDVYGGRDTIYKNNGAGDYDIDVVAPFNTVASADRGDCTAWADYNNDGKIDMLVTNAGTDNHLYFNNGGTFTCDSSNSDISAHQNSYGCAWGDYDDDGYLDFYLGNNLSGNRLFHNNGNGTFTKITTGPVATVSGPSQSGASWADFDNDGDLDLFVPTFSQNLLFTNNGSGTFTQNITEIVAKDVTVESYGGTWADYDNDGDLDLFVPTAFNNHPNDLLYRNDVFQSGAGRNWIKFHCIGVTSNTDAIGARVYVKAQINGVSKWQMREINANSTRGGVSSGMTGHVVHIGLGNASLIDSLKIVWPKSSTTQIFTNVALNRFLEITEGVNAIVEKQPCIPDLPITDLGFVHGRIYNDVNSNCTYDSGTDNPIANKFVQAEPGAYFAYTNDTGYYSLGLPAGEYNVSTNFNTDQWDLSSCQVDSLVPVSVSASNHIYDIDFSEEARIIPCDSFYELNINSIGIVQGPCDSGLVLTSPCPGYLHEYCFDVTNHSSFASAPNTVFSVVFPAGFTIIGVLPGAFGWTATFTNTIALTYPLTIPSGGTFSFCLFVIPSGNPPYLTTFDFQNSGTGGNLIVDGNFESGTNANFASDAPYVLNCAPTSVSNNYCIGNVPSAMNGGWVNPFTAVSGTNFLYADGTTTAARDVWSQNVAVNANTQYTVSGFFANIIRANIPNTAAPDMQLLIGGAPVINTGPIAAGLGWNMWAGTWCAPDSTGPFTIDIRSLSTAGVGNDFGIDSLEFFENVGPPATLLETDTCSCDPNDKLVTPVGCGPNGNIKKDQQLLYTIRFLNTGTGNAHDITLRDVLDSDLDLNTLQILSASDTITNIQVIPDTTLIVTLGGIELEPDSSGFVSFSVYPKTGLADGTAITNQAGIYFDNNAVVLTNITLSTLYDLPQPEALFTYQHDCSSSGRVYDFEYTGSTPDNATYAWTFTNGTPSTSTSQDPDNITFSSAGYKYVTLTVNRNGCTDAVYDTILVVDYRVGDDSIKVCHGESQITIHIDSLPSHLGHGDCVGVCNNNSRLAYEALPDERLTQPFAINVRPNPANQSCQIMVQGEYSSELLSMDLLNFAGIAVKSIYKGIAEKNPGSLLQTRLDLTNFASGLYLIKAQYGKETKTIKIIIQH